MRLDLYLAETAAITREQGGLLDEARTRLTQGRRLSRLEQNGVLQALQVLIENGIGKVKHLLKAAGEPVPVSAYDALAALTAGDGIAAAELPAWNAVIGLCNRIGHDYMDLDIDRVLDFVRGDTYRFVVAFLLRAESPSESL